MKFSSGKLKYIFDSIIYKMIKNFEPEVIIVSYSFGFNKNTDKHRKNGITLNEKKLLEILQ